MSRVAWYWHRLRAMGAAEVLGRVRKKSLEIADAHRERDWTSVPLKPGQTYPQLPNSHDAPEALREALRRDAEQILAGKWRAFGHIPIRVNDPPHWHKDYLADVDLPTNKSAFKLNHRNLPNGADIKLIWELSRWHQPTRLALAAYFLGDVRAARKCVHWLEHWAQHNPPYCGWNWTSALESGLRLVQFTWIDALLQPFVAAERCDSEFDQLRYKILPPHAWFTWRHKSFGSSANNHLLGELAGLILAVVRWPELAVWCVPLAELQTIWEREVLAQFAVDGGNREQALNYHLFSFEFCWHARNALRAAGRPVSLIVEERLAAAARFFVEVQVAGDLWDYGDSDNGFVLPLAEDVAGTTAEWLDWANGKADALGVLAGRPPKCGAQGKSLPSGWHVFWKSGVAVNRRNDWFLRWDFSPLGYLSTAAHGHFDALHVSIWLDGTAMIVDPGTGAYFQDRTLRDWLASREAHNGPAFPSLHPRRLGPFLWSGQHPHPVGFISDDGTIGAELIFSKGVMKRTICRFSAGDGWVVEDSIAGTAVESSFSVRWQFAPETICEVLEPRRFKITRHGKAMEILVGGAWDTVELVSVRRAEGHSVEGVVSPKFRQTTWAPYLKLIGKTGHKPCLFETTFLGLSD